MHESLDEIERYLISKVKEIRKEKGISQEELSMAIGMNITFISQIEAPSKKAKYNTTHLNLIAMALQISPRVFWPESYIPDEKYAETTRVADPKNKYKKGTKSQKEQ